MAAKTEVYSWRVAPDTKARLKKVARAANQSLGGLLDRISREWLDAARDDGDAAAQQKHLHEAASKCLGVLRGAHSYSAEETRRVIRERLARRHGRSRPD